MTSHDAMDGKRVALQGGDGREREGEGRLRRGTSRRGAERQRAQRGGLRR